MSRKPKVPTPLPPFDKEVEIRGFLFSRALTQTTCVVPAANILKPGSGKTTRIRIIGNLGADDAGQGVTGEARRARRSGGTGICQKKKKKKNPAAGSRRATAPELRERPEVGAALPEGGGPGAPRAPAAASTQLRARTAHRDPRPSAPVQPLPPKSAARAAAAGPVRTCHQPATAARRSRPALRQPRAPAGPATPFPTRCPLSGARF